jgi:hypothetical protein
MHLTGMVVFFERHINPFLAFKHAGDTDLHAGAFFSEFAVFFDG